MNAPFESLRVGDANLRSHYEDVAADAIRSIFRWKFLIAASSFVGVILAALLVSVLPRTYTAEALYYPNMTSGKDEKASLSASINGIAVVSSEAERIGSRAIAISVARRLGVEDDSISTTEPRTSNFSQKLRAAILPETVHQTELSRAVTQLRSRLAVLSDSRTYVIAVRYTASSPEFAATVANAVLFEYFRSKEKDRKLRAIGEAKQQLFKLSSTYGKRHPLVIQARTKLANAKRDLQFASDEKSIKADDVRIADGVILAEANPTPTGPPGKTILGGALVLGFIAGICGAMWLDRRDKGLKTSDEVAAYTSTRCVGLIPRVPRGVNSETAAQLPNVREALRAVAVEAGLDGSEGLKKIAMVTAIERPERVAYFTETLGRVLVATGHRVLFVDAGVSNSVPSEVGGATEEPVFLEDVLDDTARARSFFEAKGENKLTVLKVGRCDKNAGDQFSVGSRALSRFVSAAREHYDIVLIASSLIFHPTDTAIIGRESDVSLLWARWGSTSRKAVVSAIKRLRDFGVQVNGVALTDVNVGKHHRGGDFYQRLELS